jgi:predicted outer membrane repeat protein
VAIIGAGRERSVIDGDGRGPVVTAIDVDDAATLQGFTITGGSAENGGGMLNIGSSPAISDCVFRENAASAYGGGMFNRDSSPTIHSCAFIRNTAVEHEAGGGGIYNADRSNPTIDSCSFSRNTAREGFGGGMANAGSSRPVLSSVTFSDNTAARGGGLHNDDGSDATLSTVVFSANRARFSGGGIENVGSSPVIQSCVFSANLAGRGGAIYNDNSSPRIVDCIFSANKGGRTGAVGSLNVLESGLWLTLVVVSLSVILASRARHRVFLGVLVLLIGLVGAMSELYESIGGAWQAADGLLIVKAACGLALVLAFVGYRKASRAPDAERPGGTAG